MLPSFGLAATITALVVVFTLTLGWRIIRHDFLHISTVRDFSFLLLYVMIPFAINWFLGPPGYETEVFGFGGLITEEGGELVAVICAIFLLPRISRWLEEHFAQLSYPKLRKLRREVEQCLDALAADSKRASREQRMRQLFELFQVERYALMALHEGVYRRSLANGFEGPDGFKLSPEAARFLARTRNPIDLNRLPLEWRSFFIQFELERLRQATDARFLLPVSLESSLWGFLLLWNGEKEQGLTRVAIAERMRPAAMAALHQRIL